SIAASVEARIDLGRAAALGLLPPGWIAAGAANVDLGLVGQPSAPETIALEGTIGLGGLSLDAPELPAAVQVSSGSLEFGGQDLVGRGLAATIGASDLALEFALSDWIPFALGREEPP